METASSHPFTYRYKSCDRIFPLIRTSDTNPSESKTDAMINEIMRFVNVMSSISLSFVHTRNLSLPGCHWSPSILAAPAEVKNTGLSVSTKKISSDFKNAGELDTYLHNRR